MAIIGERFPILALGGTDRAGVSVCDAAQEFRARGAAVLLADPGGGGDLPAIADHPAIEPILTNPRFYRMVNALAPARGCGPASPTDLNNVPEKLGSLAPTTRRRPTPPETP